MPLPWPLSAPWPSLSIPTGFSFASLSDTRHWQRRLLRYVIRRALGGILQLPEESIDEHTHLDANLGSGNVQLKNVKLDATAINAQLATYIDSAGLPLHVELLEGSIGSVQLLLGSTTDDGTPARTLNATERLFTAPIQLKVSEAVLEIRVRVLADSAKKDSAAQEPKHGLDLAASIANVAEGYLDEASQQDSPSEEDEADPFALPGAFDRPSNGTQSKDEEQVGMVAAIVERILARLQLSVRHLRLRIHLVGTDAHDLADLEFRLEKADSQTTVQQGEKGTSFVRILSATGPGIWFREPPQGSDAPPPASPDPDSPDTSVSDDLAMSMAIADLRTSQRPERAAGSFSLEASSRSMYYSTDFNVDTATSGVPPLDEAIIDGNSPTGLDTNSGQRDSNVTWIQLLGSFPTESMSEIILRFTVSSEHVSGSSRLEITAPRFGFLAVPSAIIALSQFLDSLPSHIKVPSNPQNRPQADPPNLLVYTRISGVEVIAPLSKEDQGKATLSTLMSSAPPPSLMLHLSLNEIEGAYRLSAGEGKVALKRYYLAIQGPASWRPLLMPDPGLAWAYPTAFTKHGDYVPSSSNWHRSIGQPSRLENWRVAVPVNASSLNAQSKTPVLGDSLAVRVSRSACKVTLQPVHMWADASILQEMREAFGLYSTALTRSGNEAAEPHKSAGEQAESKYPLAISVEMACLRLDLKVPCPSTQVLRAGVFTIDIHDLSIARPSEPTACAQAPRKARFDQESPAVKTLEVSCRSMLAFVAASDPEKHGAVCILAARSMSSTILSVQALESHGEQGSPTSRVKVLVPEVGIYVDKAVSDSLQYLADDITQTLARYTEGTGQSEQIPSPIVPRSSSQRSKQSFSSLSASSTVTNESSRSSHNHSQIGTVELSVLEAQVRLSLFKDVLNGTDIVLTVADTHARVALRHNGSEDLVLDLASDTASLVKLEAGSTQTCLLRKLTQSTLPILKLRLMSSVDTQTQAKHSRIRLVANSFICNLSSDLKWASQLADTFKAPADIFTVVVPNDTTKIEIVANESIARLLPLKGQSALAISLGQLEYRIQLLRDDVRVKSRVTSHETEVWIADHAVSGSEGVQSLKSLGYARLAAITEAECQFVHNPALETQLDITAKRVKGQIEACPDTLLVLAQVLQALVPAEAASPTARQSAPLADLSGSICLPRKDDGGRLAKQSKYTAPRQTVLESDDIALTSLGRGKVAVGETWFTRKQVTDSGNRQAPSIHIRVQDTALGISLYEGYDFERSRKFVKDTVKATRKKLEKIRQLLAEGQVPEETVEEAAESLLQSVFLPQKASGAEADDLDTFERIAAFDDELDKDDVTTYSWETVQQRPNMRRTFSNGSVKQPGARLRRLRRPKTSALDVNLSGLSSTVNLYGHASPLASRISLEIRELGIIDNLRTSSWNKFLTELRPRDGGIVRPTASPMVKVQLSMVKGVDSPDQQEANLKIKVCPLRLHIDQDALDFLKAFAAFKMDTPVSACTPVQIPPPPTEPKAGGGFVQRVEIFPIKIKLDYKPKRVDYQALRQGRTIELMNFFSFEASEMVLRHLVLNGVPSWAKVGDLLQDIWTPDVKANQLADFLAGINPVRSVVNVGTGVADLVLLPVQQYKKDGRLVRGVQRGSKSFAKTTALEAIKLGARMATGTQVILEHAERVLGGRPPQSGSPVTTPSHQELFLEDMEEEDALVPDTTENLSRFSKQPTDVREGIQTAYKSLSGNMRTAAETILAVPMEVYEHSDEGPARAVVRAVPIAVLRPMIGASEAVSKTLLGLRNTLDPGARGEIQDKYKRPPSSS